MSWRGSWHDCNFNRANYREANRGVSRADFANKIGTVQKEAAETQYWLELPGVREQRTEDREQKLQPKE